MLTHEEEQALAEIFSAEVLQAEFHAWCEAMESEYGSVDAPCF